MPDGDTIDAVVAIGKSGAITALSRKVCRPTRRRAGGCHEVFDDQKRAHRVELPTSALRLLVDILAELADGNAVKVVPVHAELRTQEAADLLNVSRTHFVKLLEDGVLAFHRTGKHRRVRFADLMQYREARERASEQAMADLAQQSQELEMGYE
jgi:excisionase family DNA binding protein